MRLRWGNYFTILRYDGSERAARLFGWTFKKGFIIGLIRVLPDRNV